MGGFGSGGQPGMGRKRQTKVEAFVRGSRDRHSKETTQPGDRQVAMPEGMSEGAVAVWEELAPYAIKANTLFPQTARQFADLCESRVRMAKWQAAIERDGETHIKTTVDGAGQEHAELKAHPLISRHHGLSQRVEMGMIRFRLGAIGKEMAETTPPADPFSEFDGPVQ